MKLNAGYYQQFDADISRDVPGEGYGGWKNAEIEISPQHTAVVIMHAWDCGTPQDHPGWFRACEYLPRSYQIVEKVFPKLLTALREAEFNLFHVVAPGADYFKALPGYQMASQLAGEPAAREFIEADPILEKLRQFRGEKVFVGAHNNQDVQTGWKKLDFPEAARPRGDEPIAETSEQLFALCKKTGVNHLIYAGFAINWCLLLSPGGMFEMSKYGIMCSVFRDATTAVENKETARQELCKQVALWRVALAFGFVFDTDDFISALHAAGQLTA